VTWQSSHRLSCTSSEIIRAQRFIPSQTLYSFGAFQWHRYSFTFLQAEIVPINENSNESKGICGYQGGRCIGGRLPAEDMRKINRLQREIMVNCRFSL
jgi:hypothetical protein